jgi:hypothetical protein
MEASGEEHDDQPGDDGGDDEHEDQTTPGHRRQSPLEVVGWLRHELGPLIVDRSRPALVASGEPLCQRPRARAVGGGK